MELLEASQNGDLSRVRSLLAAGADVNETVRDYSPIYMAALNEHVNVVKELINAGADVNVQTDWGDTPLAEVCSYGQTFQPLPIKERVRLELIRLLLNAGADIHKANNKGETPIIHAASYSYYERLQTVKLLLEAGANVNDVAKSGFTALMGAAFQGHVNIVKTLIEAGADINKSLIEDHSPFGKAGDTALSIATKYGRRYRKEIIEMLDQPRRRRVVNARWADRLASGMGPIPSNLAPLLKSYLVDPSDVRPTNLDKLRNKTFTWGKAGGRRNVKHNTRRVKRTRRGELKNIHSK